MLNDTQSSDWSRTYWGLLVNQTLVVGVVALLGMAMLYESYRASKAAELYPPVLTQWYFAIGPVGLGVAAMVSIAVSIGVVGLRRRPAASVVTSVSFVICTIFLAAGIRSSILPLLIAIRERLPPESRW